MPYKNFPKDIPTSKIDACVNGVMKDGKSKESAIAICYASMVKGKEINYRKFHVSDKAITDAPNLRSDDAHTCWNCNYFKSLPNTQMQDNIAMLSEIMVVSGRGVCTQFEFETDTEWVCDAWEEIPPMIETMKQVDGHYRWFLFSSSSYEDKDKEIVSQKALEDDTDRMNTTKEFGTLDWWHTPIVLGDCDTSFMHGRISIESGTFRDDWVGERFATMKGLGASRTFYNPITEPDAVGIYHNIRTFSRAILPADKASNRLTLVDISAKEKSKMSVMDKAKELIAKLGNTPEAEVKVKELLATAEIVDKAAQEAGLTSKEKAPESITEKMARADMEAKIKKMLDDISDEDMEAAMKKMESASSKESKGGDPESIPKTVFVGDMSMDEFDAKLTTTVEKFLTPAVKEIGTQVAKMNEAQSATAKETGDKVTSSIKSVQDMQTELSARLAALEGLTPRAYRATQDPATQVDPATTKEKMPHDDAIATNAIEGWLEKNLTGKVR